MEKKHQVTTDESRLVQALAVAFPEARIAAIKNGMLKLHTISIDANQLSNLYTLSQVYNLDVELKRSAAKICISITRKEVTNVN